MKETKKRMGSPNYNHEDIKVLLDFFEGCGPKDDYYWAYISQKIIFTLPEKNDSFKILIISVPTSTVYLKKRNYPGPYLSSKCMSSEEHRERYSG